MNPGSVGVKFEIWKFWISTWFKRRMKFKKWKTWWNLVASSQIRKSSKMRIAQVDAALKSPAAINLINLNLYTRKFNSRDYLCKRTVSYRIFCFNFSVKILKIVINCFNCKKIHNGYKTVKSHQIPNKFKIT